MNFSFIFIVIAVFPAAVLIKNQMTCNVRIYFIWDQWEDYSKLPSYYRMLFNPFRWTRKQWQEYVK